MGHVDKWLPSLGCRWPNQGQVGVHSVTSYFAPQALLLITVRSLVWVSP